jgi:hypothetical protein
MLILNHKYEYIETIKGKISENNEPTFKER